MTGITTLRRGSGPGQIALQSDSLPPLPKCRTYKRATGFSCKLNLLAIKHQLHERSNTVYNLTIFSFSTGSRIQQYSIEGDGGLQSAVNMFRTIPQVAYQFPCNYAGFGFSPYAIYQRHAQHHVLPNCGREQCLLQSEPTPRLPTAEGSLVGT